MRTIIKYYLTQQYDIINALNQMGIFDVKKIIKLEIIKTSMDPVLNEFLFIVEVMP